MLELELKAVVADPDQLREALSQVATLSFEGMLRDQRFDFDTGGITRRDEVVRIRRWEGRDGTVREQLAWKGPAHLVDGYKARRELELWCGGPADANEMVSALGFLPIQAIDRWVEVWQADGASARIEWYPELDTLVEVEGSGPAIEELISACGIPRDRFSTWGLPDFQADYLKRTGAESRTSLEPGAQRPGHWPR